MPTKPRPEVIAVSIKTPVCVELIFIKISSLLL
jgi:hypothetical protein